MCDDEFFRKRFERHVHLQTSRTGLSLHDGQAHSIAEQQVWLDRGPLALDGARWFGEGHWFMTTGYAAAGIFIRDSRVRETRYLNWARLYGELAFSGWVVGVIGAVRHECQIFRLVTHTSPTRCDARRAADLA